MDRVSKKKMKEYHLKFQQLMKEMPNFPSKPGTASKLYYEDHKVEFLKQNPQLSDEDVRKTLQERFHSLDDEMKSTYVEKIVKRRAEYYLKLEQLINDNPQSNHAPVIRHHLKFVKHPEQPDVPLTAMLLYASEHQTDVFKQNPQLSKKDVREILNKRFLSLNAEQRAVYQEKYLKSMKDYWIKLENFCKNHPRCDNSSLRAQLIQLSKSKSASAATALQSDPTPEVIAPSVQVGIKRPATEEISGDSGQKSKKMRSAFEEMQNSSELQRIVKVESSTSKRKKTNKKSSVEKVVATIEVERKVTQKESTKSKKKKKKKKITPPVKGLNSSAESDGLKQRKKKKKSSAKKVIAAVVVKVEPQVTQKESAELKNKKISPPVKGLNSSAELDGLKQQKKKKSSAKKVIAAVVVKVEPQVTQKESTELKNKKISPPVKGLNSSAELDGLKQQKRKKSSAKKVIVEQKITTQSGGLKQKKKMKKLSTAAKTN